MKNAKKTVAVAIIHGIGGQKPGYSKDFRIHLDTRIKRETSPLNLVYQEFNWQDLLQPMQDGMMALYRPRIRWRYFRKFIMDFLSDSTSYQMVPTSKPGTTYAKVDERIGRTFADLRKRCDPDSPLVVIAHSLGAFIMSNYIYDRQAAKSRTGSAGTSQDLSALERMETLAGFISFGCNIPLFAPSIQPYVPIAVPASTLELEPWGTRRKWLNIYDKDDVLGWPMAEMASEALGLMDPGHRERWRGMVEDCPMEVGRRFWERWSPLSHNAYWTDPAFLDKVAGFLLELDKAVNRPAASSQAAVPVPSPEGVGE